MALELIEAGQLQSPYREFDIVVPVNSEYKLTYYHHSIEVIRASSDKYSVSFGSGTGYTSLQMGITYNYPNFHNGDIGAMSSITIKNEGAYPLFISLALGGGTIQDNRLIGSITVNGQEDAPVYTRDVRGLVADTVVLTMAAGTPQMFTPTDACMNWILQNQTGDDVVIYANGDGDGFLVPDYGTFASDCLDNVEIKAKAAGKVVVIENLVV